MKYEVTLKQIEVYCMDVEAETEKEAIEKAWELYEADKNEYHHDSESESIAYDIDQN